MSNAKRIALVVAVVVATVALALSFSTIYADTIDCGNAWARNTTVVPDFTGGQLSAVSRSKCDEPLKERRVLAVGLGIVAVLIAIYAVIDERPSRAKRSDDYTDER